MQTRRDQLQAYRFQNRRALAALVTGDANVVEPPMRRLTVMTIAGIMIAILVAVVFALLGKFSPDTGDAWKEAGAVIIDDNTGATYLYDGTANELHPVVNYTSAVLAIQGNSAAHTVHVEADDIKSAERGYPVGIPGLPYSLPSASGLVSGPWAVCSSVKVNGNTGQTSVSTVVHADSTAGSERLPDTSPVLVRGVQGGATYALVGHRRLAISAEVAASLQLTAPPIPVGTAFLDGVPAGPALQAPPISGAGDTVPFVSNARVGQLVQESGSKVTAVVLRDGFQQLSNKVETALLQTLNPGGKPLPTVQVADNLVTANLSKSAGPTLVDYFDDLPRRIDPPSDLAVRATGVCAVYSSSQPAFAVTTGGTANADLSNATESATSAGGRADDVLVPSNAAALVKSDDRAKTLFVVDPSGKKFALGSGAQGKIGYDSATPQTLARQLLSLIPTGPAMDPSAAAQRANS